MANKISGLTIEIGAETTALTKALTGVNKQSRALQSELREVDKLLKLDPKNPELVAQKQKLLAESVSNTKEKLDTLKEAEKQAQEQFKQGKIGEDQYRAIQREVIKTEEGLKKLEKQAKDFGGSLTQSLKNAGKDMQELGSKVSKAGEGMTKGLTVPILAVGAASMAAFNEVDTALDTVVTKTGATGDAMDGLEASFNAVYGSMPVDAQAAGDAIGEVNTQFGLTGEKLEEASRQMLKFAEINGQDVTSSTTDAKGAIEAYGLSANDLGNVLDAVTKTAQNTGVSTDKIFDSVTKGAPQLRAMGLDFSQSAEMMGRFEQKGIDSSKSLSYLSKAQVTFAKEGKTMADGLEELTKKITNSSSETEALTLASEYFGTKGATFMLDAIQRGALDFEDFQGAAENAAGAVTSTFEGTLDPVDKTKTAMNNLKIAGTELSSKLQEVLAPMLESLVGALQGLVNWFGNLDDGTKKTIIIVLAMVAAIGPLLLIIGKVITVVGTITSALPVLGTAFAALSGPIGIVIAIIAAVIAIGVLLCKNWDTIKQKASELWTSIVGTFDKIKSGISDKINAAKDIVRNAIDKIKSFFNFKWSLPKLKMPHVKIAGEFSLVPPKVPKFSIDWYREGGILTKPTIFGALGSKLLAGGESGTGGEAILPLNKLVPLMADAMSVVGGNGNQIIIENMTVRDDTDIEKIAVRLDQLRSRKERGRR